MTQDEVLEMFRKHAEVLGKVEESQRDIILSLAQLLAESNGRLSKENFDKLVHIGAVMYQEGLGQFNARNETAAIMKRSVQERKKSI
jgi:hypothetical protein